MQGYGGQGMAQQITPEQYAQALQTYDALSQKQQHQQMMAQSGNPFALLGAALGGTLAKKFGKHKGQNLSDVELQIQAFQQQKQAELAAIEEAKRKREEMEKWNRQQEAEKTKFEREHGGRMALKQFDIKNRQPAQQGFNERLFNQLNPDQKAAYMNKFAGVQQQGNQLFTPQEQALIQAGKINPEQLAEVKANEAMGVKTDKKPSGEAMNKLGLLETAERDLNQYIKEAFVNGDYQELGSKFGGTNAKLKSAVMNALRAESGAAIGDKEIDNFMDTYAPGMFSSDETNMKKIQGLVEKIKTQKAALGGGLESSQRGNLTPQGMAQTQQLLNKYLSK